MPVLKFTQADKLKSMVATDGWYTGVIASIEGPKKSSSGKSFNYFVTFKITEGKLSDKEFVVVFNTESNSPSVLGTQQFYPFEYLLQVIAAVQRVNFEEVEIDTVDTESIINQPFDFNVKKGVYDGIILNTIQGFLPEGKGAKQTSTVPF